MQHLLTTEWNLCMKKFTYTKYPFKNWHLSDKTYCFFICFFEKAISRKVGEPYLFLKKSNSTITAIWEQENPVLVLHGYRVSGRHSEVASSEAVASYHLSTVCIVLPSTVNVVAKNTSGILYFIFSWRHTIEETFEDYYFQNLVFKKRGF